MRAGTCRLRVAQQVSDLDSYRAAASIVACLTNCAWPYLDDGVRRFRATACAPPWSIEAHHNRNSASGASIFFPKYKNPTSTFCIGCPRRNGPGRACAFLMIFTFNISSSNRLWVLTFHVSGQCPASRVSLYFLRGLRLYQPYGVHFEKIPNTRHDQEFPNTRHTQKKNQHKAR